MKRLILLAGLYGFLILTPNLYAQTGKFPDADQPKEDKIELVPEINKRKVEVGERVELRLILKWKGAGDRYRLGISDIKTKNLVLKKQSQSSERERGSEGDINLRYYLYELSPPASGEAIIEPISIKYDDKTTGQSSAIDVPAFYLKVRPKPFEPKNLIIPSIIILFIVSGGITAMTLRKRVKEKASVQKRTAPEDTALGALESADVILRDHEIPNYIEKLDGILRNFLYEKYNLVLEGQSQKELSVELEGNKQFERQDIRLLISLLMQFQEARFGGIAPSYAEATAIKNQVHDFIAGKKAT